MQPATQSNTRIIARALNRSVCAVLSCAGETTAIGEPKPGPYGRASHAQSSAASQSQQQPKELDTTDVFSMVGSKTGDKSEPQDTSVMGMVKSPLGLMFGGLCVVSGVSIALRNLM